MEAAHSSPPYRDGQQYHSYQHHVGSRSHTGSSRGLPHGRAQDRPQRPGRVEARHDRCTPTALDPQAVGVLCDVDDGVRPAHDQQAAGQDDP